MAHSLKKKRFSTEEVVQLLEEDTGNLYYINDSEEGENWQNREDEDTKPDPPRFKPARTPGPTFYTTTSLSPLSLFQLFSPASAIKTIIKNINAKAEEKKKAGLKFKWKELTVKDFNIFLSIIIFTGLVSVPHRSDYWRKKWPSGKLSDLPFISSSIRKHEGFKSISISTSLTAWWENTAQFDCLFKIKPLYTEILNACKSNFQPYQNLSIDEWMVATKAQISTKQYIKNKPTKWSYKLFVLADSSVGYTWNFFFVYTGKTNSTTGHGSSYSAVMNLLPFQLLGTGYQTIRKNRTGIHWIRRDNLLFVKWMDTSEVTMCSIVHQVFSDQTVRRKVKERSVWNYKSIPLPDCVVDYNKHKGGVNLSDALLSFYSVQYKTAKWYKTLFYHLVDIAVVNSYLLHKELQKFRQDPIQSNPLTHKAFMEELAMEMLEFAEPSEATPTPNTCVPIFYDSEMRARKYCKRCQDAGMPRVKTDVYCKICNIPLCLSAKKNCY
uniref:PiggyBac transposable element-derived protein domain-containing protein n=1 Tax=Nothobranchius furzeri TaxID=105023 RepID=A0A8C6M6M7_NOTFU